jgi:hypothetical protein
VPAKFVARAIGNDAEVWDELTNDRGELATVVYDLVEHGEADLDERQADLLRSWLARIPGGAANIEIEPLP